MTYETLLTEQRDNGVFTITMNRPEKLNALSPTMIAELKSVFQKLRLDRSVRCVVLTGAGRAFCAGLDVGSLSGAQRAEGDGPPELDLEGRRLGMRESGQGMMRALRAIDVPTIASVNGVCVGGGLDLVCTADMAVGSTASRYQVAYVKRGLFADLGGFWTMPKAMAFRKSFELMMTGEFMSADEAFQYGLLNYVASPEELAAKTAWLADTIAAGPPIAQKLGKMLAYRSANLDFDSALEWSATAINVAQNSRDHAESLRAFVEKRPANFTGR